MIRLQYVSAGSFRITVIFLAELRKYDRQVWLSLCTSGDSGSGIFIWLIDSTLKEEPLNKWYEHNDWLYRGVTCLAVSRIGYLYTGSRDKSIKAWSLEVLSLLFF